MSDGLDQLLFLDAILHRFPEVESQLVRPIQGDQRCHGNEAAVALR